ncbi:MULTISPECIES: cofactor-independent phosphoglycerate mutase [Dehalococcoides]|jgi:2,3-bisphosphoglycerate-independent phosphoglycerate mutase|uniref:Cofactor-independent phosphoglycerate mutase n=2 Tax=Dehalococcoides mccartyi TaxID=61435 RepID=A0A142VC53_9CHLR|nr:cofactor-independent phosphoglycerate mutase [Dehalococcoides mccartyi]AGG08636.1 cofactor-independent phosphoglycerate mutase [Dehalococcoides mccartyi BTF08]AII61619.1 phosphoglycerate mutase [Dehalococcoides mccartyi CG5]AMU87423.1 cofactor-independent phosphoglycerate mutase [Dehalococcoides mccartyi]AOW00065.1 homoserine kinase-like protein [Dehalococcoides mccartyi]AQU06562.1 cofactor-independent phosphoglycerate mutase [Dehalococcoides mccartyi]
MKYCVLITDGASGWGLKEQGGKTALELAHTPNLDKMARNGFMGLSANVPPGMEPSSACACMSLLGYDPEIYYKGRAAIEAVSMGVSVAPDEVIFRCNLVSIIDGKMASYSAGHISSQEASELLDAVSKQLGSERVKFYPGVNYRHLLKLKGMGNTANALCTPPHDISDREVSPYLPQGEGSLILNQLISSSQQILRDHPLNLHRQSQGKLPANSIWLFWGSGPIPPMPSFKKAYGLDAALTSGVDLLRGLGLMMDMKILELHGITDGLNNDFSGQMQGGLSALRDNDMAVIHVEAPDEAGHAGSLSDKVKAIELIDEFMVSKLLSYPEDIRVLVMPDHPTPIKLKTHVAEPVPFLMWGKGFSANGVSRFTEKEALKTGIIFEKGCTLMQAFLK